MKEAKSHRPLGPRAANGRPPLLDMCFTEPTLDTKDLPKATSRGEASLPDTGILVGHVTRTRFVLLVEPRGSKCPIFKASDPEKKILFWLLEPGSSNIGYMGPSASGAPTDH